MTNEKLIKDHAIELLGNLFKDIAAKKQVEIRFEFEENSQWSVVSMHEYDEDREISLRLMANDIYLLYLGYYDDKDEYFEILQELTDEEKAAIPNHLKKVMGKVLADEQGLRVPGNLLLK